MSAKKTDYQKELDKIIALNLEKLRNHYRYTQDELCIKLKENGINVTQGTISKYLSVGGQSVPTSVLLKLCVLFKIPFDFLVNKVLSDDEIQEITSRNYDLYAYEYKEKTEIENDIEELYKSINYYTSKTIITDPAHPLFNNLDGKYYGYFFPTVKNENEILVSSIRISKVKNICKINLKLTVDEKKEKYKDYEGFMVIANKVNTCYCILKSSEIEGELCFLAFTYFGLNHNPLHCCMAEVLTVCSSQPKCPTVHRMLISSDEILDKDLQIIKPHLYFNHSDILIETEKFMNFIDNYNLPEKAKSHILSMVSNEEKKFYSFNETFLTGTFKQVSLEDDALDFVTKLRDYSFTYKNNKISPKLDKTVHDLLNALGYFKKV